MTTSPPKRAPPRQAKASPAASLPSPTAAAVANAPASALPARLSPQLATLASQPPKSGDWGYEIKFDGYRILARTDDTSCRLFTRNGNDWTDKMISLAAAVFDTGIRNAWLDCEAVVLGADGLPSFNALQNAFDRIGTESIKLFVFDVPYLDGKDLRSLPLRVRRAILQERLAAVPSDRVRFSEEFVAPGADVLASACKMGLEGVMAKRQDAPYAMKRTETWLKLKCHQRQEFVVGGFTDRGNAAREVGSLLLGVYDDEGRLRSAGSVGTGWNSEGGAAMWQRLIALETKTSPFDAKHAPNKGRWSKRSLGSERWVKPQLVAEVTFAEWTPDGSVRHASFEGLREDKSPIAVRRESPVAIAPALPASVVKRPAIRVSNPERVIDASTGLTKMDLVSYYERVAQWMLPHLKDRPTSLVRGPTGVGGELFFQKHGEKIGVPGIRELDPGLWPGHKALLEIPSAQALVSAAQMNTIEFHTWNSVAAHIDRPDRMIFDLDLDLDLDPGEGVEWPHIQEAAVLMRTMLETLSLRSWLKTSGGKGLHVVVPLAPELDYDTVNTFSKAIVQHMAKVLPSRFVAVAGGGNRLGKIFIDYLRNGHGATTAAAFSARSRPGLGVSMPIDWEQLQTLRGGAHWTISTAPGYLASRADDPWTDYWISGQSLANAMQFMEFGPPKARRARAR